MIALPKISVLRHDLDIFEAALHISPSLAVFDGHFPGQPVLAGVVQIAWAEHLARKAFELEAAATGLEQLKFRALITPDTELELRLQNDALRARISFTYTHLGKVMSSGRLSLRRRA